MDTCKRFSNLQSALASLTIAAGTPAAVASSMAARNATRLLWSIAALNDFSLARNRSSAAIIAGDISRAIPCLSPHIERLLLIRPLSSDASPEPITSVSRCTASRNAAPGTTFTGLASARPRSSAPTKPLLDFMTLVTAAIAAAMSAPSFRVFQIEPAREDGRSRPLKPAGELVRDPHGRSSLDILRDSLGRRIVAACVRASSATAKRREPQQMRLN
mmetsp:Transcript_97161/g.274663  ORF Transcript_97161/g.274663 Transcript_97161/m.274663 type:complete len:217 (+) Transcript_97161:121-771(+)